MATTTTVIVDQDGGVDDALALVLLARTPGVEIVGVGSVHGNVSAAAAADNGLRALELAGDHSTAVAVGASDPLARPLHLAHPEDLLGKAAGSPKRTPVREETAAEQLVRLAWESPGRVDLLTLGPLTNVALALQAEPELPRLVRRVVSMAGAFEVTGNISDCAESNVWHDPEAAAQVVAAGFDLTLVPLDVTRNATVTRLWLERRAADQDRLWGRMAAMLLAMPGKLPAFPLHDPLAAAILLDPSIARFCHASVTVDVGERRGQTQTGEATPGANTAVVVAADASALLAQLTHALLPCRR
ncbi:nucleoside hydrolase [Amycolatopsis sp. Poz14]|uniref:nucleoside hydrolase n=1 Tax=Amycolatopsis sp. Poz14 TaxID=1447705 RepID=UPI001EE87B6A|nr:nucleoside hydrolase [Amycolatopsis sp. Poz14]MCG3751871.1 nucleoside hydrolase [Amycolatopsis sp. Poz14]